MKRRASKAFGGAVLAATVTALFVVPGNAGTMFLSAQAAPPRTAPRTTARTPAVPVNVLTAALTALGPDVRTLKFSGFGSSYVVGQSPAPASAWPRLTLKKYDAYIDYGTESMLLELVREGPAIWPRGGGQPFTGEQRQTQAVSGMLAWNVAAPPPPARGTPPPAAAAPAGASAPAREAAPAPVEPAPAALAERRAEIVLTPHGFLKSAIANKASLQPAAGGTQVTFSIGTRRFEGLINAKNQLTRAATSIANPVLGEMPVENVYSGYEKFGLVSFPTRILQRQGGFPTLDMFVATVTANDALTIAVPDSVRTATPVPPRVEVQSLGDGVHYLRGGSHHSVAIEMTDHLVLVEAPLDEARANAVLAALKGLAPAKPLRTVINTHHHFDHAGGLRTMTDAGAAVVTQAVNARFFEATWAALQPGKKPALTGFADKQVITDGRRTIELHRVAGSAHHDGLTMVYLPAEKLLIEADVYTPPDATPAAPARDGGAGPASTAPAPPINPVILNFYENVQRLKLDVATIVPLHGSRTAPIDDLARAAGR